MKKGISPVVAVVLLIAIAVIAAIGVWYWVGVYTGKPPGGALAKVAISIESCNGTSVLIRNTGGVDALLNADIYDRVGAYVGVINFSAANLVVKNVSWINISDGAQSALSGVYSVTDPDYPSYEFTC